ncbi:MAG TPA: nuclear transport factor 2 family protein [Coleofasciculaceae cyanobacterium]
MERSSSDLPMAVSHQDPGSIEITESILLQYFETLNAGDFQTTASLFAPEGILYPPFEVAIVGREAIAAYLEKEAKGITALPQEKPTQVTESDDTEIRVVGKVQTSLFTVNVAWHFVLNPETEIVAVRVRLLAALEELLNLKR